MSILSKHCVYFRYIVFNSLACFAMCLPSIRFKNSNKNAHRLDRFVDFCLPPFFLHQNTLSQKTLKQFFFLVEFAFSAPILEFPGSKKKYMEGPKVSGQLRSIITMIGEGPMSTPLAVTNARRLVTSRWTGGWMTKMRVNSLAPGLRCCDDLGWFFEGDGAVEVFFFTQIWVIFVRGVKIQNCPGW